MFALADALREEYLAVVEAGFVLQIDDPGLPDWWDMIKPAMSVEDYIDKFAKLRIDALNHALQGHPRGPRPLSPVLGKLARAAHPRSAVRAHHQADARGESAVLFVRGRERAPRARMEALGDHEAAGRQDDPAGRRQPLDQPDRASGADRRSHHALRASCVGRENVIAGTDCGLGGRVHAEIAWAKLGALAEGAKLASKRLW